MAISLIPATTLPQVTITKKTSDNLPQATASVGSGLAGFSNPLSAAVGTYSLIDSFGKPNPTRGAMYGAAVGAYAGTTIFPGIGTAIGTALGAIGGAIFGSFKNGKHIDQVSRDTARTALQHMQAIDSNYTIGLADGSRYDIGLDGGHRLLNTDGTKRHAYDVDFSNPLAQEAVGWLQPLMATLFGKNEKLKNDFTGYLVNAATSNATSLAAVRDNVAAIYNQFGISTAELVKGLTAQLTNGVIDKQHCLAYINGIRTLVLGTTSTGASVAESNLGTAE